MELTTVATGRTVVDVTLIGDSADAVTDVASDPDVALTTVVGGRTVVVGTLIG